jgi:hypothetical protein
MSTGDIYKNINRRLMVSMNFDSEQFQWMKVKFDWGEKYNLTFNRIEEMSCNHCMASNSRYNVSCKV